MPSKMFNLTLRLPDGTPVCAFRIEAEEVAANPTEKPTNGNTGGEKVTEQQIKALYAIVRRKEKLTDNQRIAEWLRKHFGVKRIDEVPREIATAFIRQHQPEGGGANGS